MHLPYRKKAGLTLMKQELYPTALNSVLEITEPCGLKGQSSGMKGFLSVCLLLNEILIAIFLHASSGTANFY